MFYGYAGARHFHRVRPRRVETGAAEGAEFSIMPQGTTSGDEVSLVALISGQRCAMCPRGLGNAWARGGEWASRPTYVTGAAGVAGLRSIEIFSHRRATRVEGTDVAH